MKKFRRIMALLIATVMVMSMGAAAFAADITIQNAGGITTDHKYEAYQIFSGTLTEEGEGDNITQTLTNIEWANGVNSAALLTALKADTTIGSKFTSCTSASDVAKALKDATADDMIVFSRVVAEHLGTKAGESSIVEGKAKITDLADGYYFVKDVTTMPEEGTDALSAYIVQLIGSKTINIKTDAPEIEKKLKNDGEADAAYRDANNVAVGDKVDYKLTSKVPNMDNYKQYYFIVHDTLSEGLTFNDDIAIKIGETTLTKDTDYTVTTSGTTEIEIVFKNFIGQKANKGKDIVITYTATLNDKAKVGKEGNPNEVYLEYSHNPNKEGNGEDKPGPNDDDVTGVTPKDTVITYTTNLLLKKVDEAGNPLDSVTFTITGYKKNDKVTYTQAFVENAAGDYYKLKDGTYTQTAPTDLTASKYDSTTKKYKLEIKKDNEVVTSYASESVTTDNTGVIDIGKLLYGSNGGTLAAGTYVIHETATKPGYNMLEHDIVVTITNNINGTPDISFEDPAKNTTITWQADGGDAVVKADGTIEMTVQNQKGSTLPETGGIGTTMFYIVGAILVIGAGVVLVSRRRMNVQ